MTYIFIPFLKWYVSPILLNLPATWIKCELKKVFKLTLIWKLGKTSKPLSKYEINQKIRVCAKTYLLKLVIRSAKDFSQAYIFIILMPVITSFMVLILVSVKAAVLLLRGQMWETSLSDHSKNFLTDSSRGTAKHQGSNDSRQLS